MAKPVKCPKCGNRLDLYGDTHFGWQLFCGKCKYEFPEDGTMCPKKDALIQKFNNRKVQK